MGRRRLAAICPQSFFIKPATSNQANDFTALAKLLGEIEQGRLGDPPVLSLHRAAVLRSRRSQQLGAAGLADEAKGPRRVVIEKPFGTDLASAKHLNEAVHNVFAEQQVYRIDHYLGKETVQNMLVLRFANSIFEPVWNRHYIDHVQITVAEEVDCRPPRRILRQKRRAARHVPEPSAATADGHGHGIARPVSRPTPCATKK